MTGESGNGTEGGERGGSLAVVDAVGGDLRRAALVVDTSAADRLARNRSSRFNLCRGLSRDATEGVDVLCVRCDAGGLFVIKDLRKVESADSARCPEGELAVETGEREEEAFCSSDCVSVELRGGVARFSTAWRNWENMDAQLGLSDVSRPTITCQWIETTVY